MACYYYSLTISSADLADATGNSNPSLNGVVFFGYTDCDGNPQEEQFASAGSFTSSGCVDDFFLYQFYYYKNDSQVLGISSASPDIPCGLTTTPTPTPTETPTVGVTPTPTETPASTPDSTPASTPTPTNLNCNCFSLTYSTGTLPVDLYVRYRDCVLGTVQTDLISSLLQRDNLDGTFTAFICVTQGLSYATPVCVQGGLEVTCDPFAWISGGICSDSIDCDILATPTPTPNTTPSSTPALTPNTTPSSTSAPTPTVTPTPQCGLCPGSGWEPYDAQSCYRINVTGATPPSSTINLAPHDVNVYSEFGSRFYTTGFPTSGIGTVQVELGTPIVGGVYTNPTWSNPNSLTTEGPLNRCAIWTDPFASTPINTWIGFSDCLTGITATKTYYVGIGADNEFRLVLDGVEILNTVGNVWTDQQFKWWHVYPVEIGAGDHTLELYGLNLGSDAGFGCEIYDNTLEDLTGFTSYSQINVIYTSSGETQCTIVQDLSGNYLSSGFTCPSGYVYSTCSGSCVEYEFCSLVPTPTPTPTQTSTPTSTSIDNCVCFQVVSDVAPGPNQFNYLDCSHVPQTINDIPFGNTQYVCGIDGSTSGANISFTTTDEIACGGCFEVATPTPTNTGTPTPTPTETLSPTTTPTETLTPTPTALICNCFSLTYSTGTLPEDLYVRYRDCVLGTVQTTLVSALLQRDNLDGTFTAFICVTQGLSYSTPVCVEGGFETNCNPFTWISGGSCSDSIDCDISVTPTQTPTNTETPTQTPTQTPTETTTSTPTETPTQTPTPSVTIGLTPTATETPTPTQTETPTNTPTETPAPTQTETPTNTPTSTPTSTPTNTPSQTPTNTSTSTQTPTPTNTITASLGYIVQFVDCTNSSNFFRFNDTTIPSTTGITYHITASTEFEGCATVIPTNGLGPIYDGTGVTFVQTSGGCGDDICPRSSNRAALLYKCTDSSVFYANVEEDTAFVGAAYLFSGECYSFVEFSGPGGPDLGDPDFVDCGSCTPTPTPTGTPQSTPTNTPTISPSPSACAFTEFCFSTTLPSFSGYNGNYDLAGTYNSRNYYSGDGFTSAVIYYTGDYWCLASGTTPGGICLLRGSYPCNSQCPDISANDFEGGICPTPTPTGVDCSTFDFNAYFDCDWIPVPTPTPSIGCDDVNFNVQSIGVTPTPTSSGNFCSGVGINFSISGYTPDTPTVTLTPSVTLTRTVSLGGTVTFEMLDETFSCVSVKVLTDCQSGEEYYTTDSLSFEGTPVVIGITMFVQVNGVERCVVYSRDDKNFSSNSNLGNITQIYSSCEYCSTIPTPTPTITSTPTNTPTSTAGVTPSPTATQTATPSQTATFGTTPPPTPSQTRTATPTNTPTPSITASPSATPNYVYVYQSCSPIQNGKFQSVTQVIQTQKVSFVSQVDVVFKDINNNCWRYVGRFNPNYIAPINVNAVTFNGDFFNGSPSLTYPDCSTCETQPIDLCLTYQYFNAQRCDNQQTIVVKSCYTEPIPLTFNTFELGVSGSFTQLLDLNVKVGDFAIVSDPSGDFCVSILSTTSQQNTSFIAGTLAFSPTSNCSSCPVYRTYTANSCDGTQQNITILDLASATQLSIGTVVSVGISTTCYVITGYVGLIANLFTSPTLSNFVTASFDGCQSCIDAFNTSGGGGGGGGGGS
jgi:hypothetical protein